MLVTASDLLLDELLAELGADSASELAGELAALIELGLLELESSDGDAGPRVRVRVRSG